MMKLQTGTFLLAALAAVLSGLSLMHEVNTNTASDQEFRLRSAFDQLTLLNMQRGHLACAHLDEWRYMTIFEASQDEASPEQAEANYIASHQAYVRAYSSSVGVFSKQEIDQLDEIYAFAQENLTNRVALEDWGDEFDSRIFEFCIRERLEDQIYNALGDRAREGEDPFELWSKGSEFGSRRELLKYITGETPAEGSEDGKQ